MSAWERGDLDENPKFNFLYQGTFHWQALSVAVHVQQKHFPWHVCHWPQVEFKKLVNLEHLLTWEVLFRAPSWPHLLTNRNQTAPPL